MGHRIVRISEEFLRRFLCGKGAIIGPCEVVEGLPADAKLIRILPEDIRYARVSPTLNLMYESSEWEGPREGDIVPDITIIYRSIAPKGEANGA